MEEHKEALAVHPSGEQPPVDAWSATADTFAGRVRVEWDDQVAVTPFGQLPFFIDYLKQAGLFDEWVADCPLHLTRPNAPSKRDPLGTLMLSVLAGHRRYAHITALRCESVNTELLGMKRVVSEDSVRRGLTKIAETQGLNWLQNHLAQNQHSCHQVQSSIGTLDRQTPCSGSWPARPGGIGASRGRRAVMSSWKVP